MDNFEEGISKTLYYLETREGERYALHFTGKLPHLRSGLRIRIRNGIILDKHIAVPAPTDANLQTSPKTSRPQSVTGQKKVAVILFNFQDNTSEHSTEEIRKKVYDNTNDYYKEASFNKLSISGYKSSNGEQDIYGWYTIPINASSGCDNYSWADAANELAVKNDNFKESNYSNIMYFFPYNDNCRWGGQADVGSLTSNDNQTYESWINGTTSFYTIAHELGHNFGTRHAASYTCYDKNKNTVSISDDCDFWEYGDPFDVMGTGASFNRSPYHMSSFNKTQTGWLDSQNVQNVEKDGTFTLFPIEQKSSSIQAIKIPRGTYSESADYDDYYFLEYRQRYGYDVFDQEGDAVVNGISIRLIKSYNPNDAEDSYLIDATPGSNNNYDEFNDAALAVGETFKDDIANIEIKTISVSAESAEVEIKTNYVCKRENPSISIDPFWQEAQAGDTAQYTLTLTNNDNAANCESSVFNITPTLPDNLSQSLSFFKITLNPNETKTQTFTIATNAAESGVYEFMETAVNESAPEFRQSAKAQISISLNIPKTPANFKAQAGKCGTKSIELTWNDVDNESYYNLTRRSSGNDKTITISKNKTSYTDKDVKDGHTYYYDLRACNNSGCSNAVSIGPIKAPSGCQTFKTLTIERKGNGFGKITIINKSDNNKKTVCDLSSEDNNKCEYQYPEKSKLKLQAKNSSGSRFKKWAGDCSRISKICNITLTSDTTVMAEFAAKNKK